MSPANLILGNAPLNVGRELARGGEGAIFEIPGRSVHVAKIYNTSLHDEKASKLRSIVSLQPTAPASTAWPSEIILRNGRVVGFIMPRIDGMQDLHVLLNGASRRKAFPNADYRTLVATAANLARAVSGVHEVGYVIGDVNERFAMVGKNATVTLIDCDSYQFEENGALHTCDVGVGLYQPPELQGVTNFRRLQRSRNHDAFGLAVLIFQLLFLGRHPFAGIPRTGEAPELSDAIRQFEFSWAGRGNLTQPPNTLNLADVGEKISFYFRRAFGEEGAQQGRPKPSAWAQALADFGSTLKRCSRNTSHWHLNDHCALCRLEGATNAVFFPSGLVLAEDLFGIEGEAAALWSKIVACAAPGPAPSVPLPADFSSKIAPKPYDLPIKRNWFGSVLEKVGVLENKLAAERKRRAQNLAESQAKYQDLVDRFRSCDPRAAFHFQVSRLTEARSALGEVFARRRNEIKISQERMALSRFLAGHSIADAGIRGLGRQILSNLAARGIETAADIAPIELEKVPGIGPKRREALGAWRNAIAARYRPTGGSISLDRATLQAIEATFSPEITRLVSILRSGPSLLQKFSQDQGAMMQGQITQIASLAREVAQAKSDFDATK